jgi:hypothetical protein
MLRRSSPFLVLGFIAVVASCDSYGVPGGNGTPVSVVLMNARIKGAGYTTYPKINYYSVGQATFEISTINSDTCVVAPYDSAAVPATSPTRIGAGAFMIMAVSGDTDSLYKASTSDETYAPSNLVGYTFNPGDSVWFNVAGDPAGFPQLQGSARTAEPFTITTPTIPPVGSGPMTINWTPATDLNAAMYISLIYNTGGGTALNTQIFCDYHDDGQGLVQANLLPALSSSVVPWVMHAQRVRSAVLLPTIRSGYMNVVSTFEVPTPISP